MYVVNTLMNDQNKIREHLIACFGQRKVTTFPLYEKGNTEKLLHTKKDLRHRTGPDNQLD